jgi:DNA-binding LytR/AlgR family response regulator
MTKIVRNLNPSDLMFLKSDINYTEVYLADGRKCVTSYTLKIFENSDIALCGSVNQF